MENFREEIATVIEKEVDRILPESTGKFRYVLLVKEIYFFSEPMDRDGFLTKWAEMDIPELHKVQYESKTEYTPGRYMWHTF